MKIEYRIALLIGSLCLTSCAGQGTTHQDIVRKHYGSWEKDIGYTQVVQQGKTLYISGVVGSGKNMAEQVESVYKTIQTMLKDFNTDSSRIVKEVVYTKDMEALKATIELRKSFFADGLYPSSSWIQIDRLFMDEHLLEVEVEVSLP